MVMKLGAEQELSPSPGWDTMCPPPKVCAVWLPGEAGALGKPLKEVERALCQLRDLGWGDPLLWFSKAPPAVDPLARPGSLTDLF